MDAWLKWLIAAACAVVIVAGGYYLWRDYTDRAEAERVQEVRALQAMCNTMMRELESGPNDNDWRVLHVVKCVVDGYVSEKDFKTPNLRAVLSQAQGSIDYRRKQDAQGG